MSPSPIRRRLIRPAGLTLDLDFGPFSASHWLLPDFAAIPSPLARVRLEYRALVIHCPSSAAAGVAASPLLVWPLGSSARLSAAASVRLVHLGRPLAPSVFAASPETSFFSRVFLDLRPVRQASTSARHSTRLLDLSHVAHIGAEPPQPKP